MTRSHANHVPAFRWLRAFLRSMSCAALALVITSCGAHGSTGGEAPPTVEPETYAWNLPVIDTAADGADREIYQALQKGCDDGESMLRQKWQQSSSPRDVLMFAAGVQACRGDMNQARTLYVRARDEYGLAGLGPQQDAARCGVYKSVASVLERAPRDRFPCMDGTSPAFKLAADGTPDDPLTPVDESAPVAISTPQTSTAAAATKAPTAATRHPATPNKPAPTATRHGSKPTAGSKPATGGKKPTTPSGDGSNGRSDDRSDQSASDDDARSGDDGKGDDKGDDKGDAGKGGDGQEGMPKDDGEGMPDSEADTDMP
jgi:hypothetical protein